MNILHQLLRSGGAAVAVTLSLGFGPSSLPSTFASEADSPSSIVIGSSGAKSLQLGVGRSMIVDLPEDAAEIFVGEPKVANAIVRSPRRLYISTLSAGQTSIFALSASGRKIAVLEITVGRDVGELAKLFEVAIPGNDINIKTVGGSIILTGSVGSAGEAQKALDIAQGFLSNNQGALAGVAAGAAGASSSQSGGVVNSLTIRGLDQVSLRVTISEIRREIIKQLGISYIANGGTNGLTNLALSNPLGINGNAASESATLGWTVGSATLSATLQAYEQQGVAKTLAEPTVTAISGESAKFLAGGTIPIPGSESCQNGICELGIVQQPYGVSLNFTPVVLSQSRIQLRIATEVTDIDHSNTLQLQQTSIPGFRTRKNETTVELPSGGSIATAGLISQQTQSAISGLPGLMNLPVLGALFRSRDFLHQDTELVIVVTPYIVHAIDPRMVQRPDAGLIDSTDPQAWLLGKVNRTYSTSYSANRAPAYTGKVGFITD